MSRSSRAHRVHAGRLRLESARTNRAADVRRRPRSGRETASEFRGRTDEWRSKRPRQTLVGRARIPAPGNHGHDGRRAAKTVGRRAEKRRADTAVHG